MTFTLASAEAYLLPRPLATGDVVKFSCDTADLATGGQDNTYLNLLSGDGDVLLTISFRVPHNVVVFNSQPHGAGWGLEEVNSFQGCLQNGRGGITVTETTSAFDIVIDNTLRHTYPKRIFRPTVCISHLGHHKKPSTEFSSDLVVSISHPTPSVSSPFPQRYFSLPLYFALDSISSPPLSTVFSLEGAHFWPPRAFSFEIGTPELNRLFGAYRRSHVTINPKSGCFQYVCFTSFFSLILIG
jgi:hypothetical protein